MSRLARPPAESSYGRTLRCRSQRSVTRAAATIAALFCALILIQTLPGEAQNGRTPAQSFQAAGGGSEFKACCSNCSLVNCSGCDSIELHAGTCPQNKVAAECRSEDDKLKCAPARSR